mmetsp:Transcript_15304/g.31093  ORF Transcript_15304/g.31093 Transcript_15304/m.31093 type:complete len:156 (-) Transcript_15304:413-880(-)
MGVEHGDGEGHMDYEMFERRGRDGTQRRGSRRRTTRSTHDQHRNPSWFSRGLETCVALVPNSRSVHVHLREAGMGALFFGIPMAGAVMGLLSLANNIPLLPEVLQLVGLYWTLKSQGVPIARISMNLIRRIQQPSIGLASVLHSSSTQARDRRGS